MSSPEKQAIEDIQKELVLLTETLRIIEKMLLMLVGKDDSKHEV
jgi:hypothetical protein